MSNKYSESNLRRLWSDFTTHFTLCFCDKCLKPQYRIVALVEKSFISGKPRGNPPIRWSGIISGNDVYLPSLSRDKGQNKYTTHYINQGKEQEEGKQLYYLTSVL